MHASALADLALDPYTARLGERVSINPFDDDNGSFLVLVNDEEQHSLLPDIRPKTLPERLTQGARLTAF